MVQYLSLRKAAARMGIHHATLSRAVKRGEIAPDSVTPGGFMRFSQSEVERFYRERILYSQPSTTNDFNVVSERRASLSHVHDVLEFIPDLARKMVPGRVRGACGNG